MASMDGQVALVTGGARGIGLAISTKLADRGVRVAVGYSHGADTAKQFAAAHEGSTIHQGNIGVAADCQRVIGEVLEQHGQLDILVNNAGITIDKTVRKMSVEDWDRVLHVNLSGAFYLSRAVLQHLVDDPLAVGGDAEVALVDGRSLVRGRELLGRVGAVGVADRDLDPAFGEPGADRQPDPAGTAGDERDLTVHAGHMGALPPAGGLTG
jgi:NAD(P)-dependent dehydrogenase (short-subunit alcohol dehydrogenase family)